VDAHRDRVVLLMTPALAFFYGGLCDRRTP
jgi:ammonia channel protein AmtB